MLPLSLTSHLMVKTARATANLTQNSIHGKLLTGHQDQRAMLAASNIGQGLRLRQLIARCEVHQPYSQVLLAVCLTGMFVHSSFVAYI